MGELRPVEGSGQAQGAAGANDSGRRPTKSAHRNPPRGAAYPRVAAGLLVFGATQCSIAGRQCRDTLASIPRFRSVSHRFPTASQGCASPGAGRGLAKVSTVEPRGKKVVDRSSAKRLLCQNKTTRPPPIVFPMAIPMALDGQRERRLIVHHHHFSELCVWRADGGRRQRCRC